MARLDSASSRGGYTRMFIMYILISKVFKKTYTGHTDNIAKRLKDHNLGRSTFSKRYRPWEVIHKEEFKTEQEAGRRERYLKTAAGRRYLKKTIFNNKRMW